MQNKNEKKKIYLFIFLITFFFSKVKEFFF